jgi:hypothetical protein
VAERSNAAVLKTVVPKGTGGSNPSSSAELKTKARIFFEFGLFISIRFVVFLAEVLSNSKNVAKRIPNT